MFLSWHSYWGIFGGISEYANANQLQQDHPCVINLLRSNYLRLPAPNNLPYQMDHPEVMDPSDGQSKVILKMLQRKVWYLNKLITHIKATSKQWFSLLFKDQRLFHRMRWFRRRIPVQHSVHGTIPRLEWIADWSRQKSVQSTSKKESKSLYCTRLS